MAEIIFDPIGAESQARIDNPSYKEARERQESEKIKYLEPVIAYFAILEEEVANMPIDQRFSRDKGPYIPESQVDSLLPGFIDLNEADYKRATLTSALLSAKNRAMSIISEIEYIIMDMEATKRD